MPRRTYWDTCYESNAQSSEKKIISKKSVSHILLASSGSLDCSARTFYCLCKKLFSVTLSSFYAVSQLDRIAPQNHISHLLTVVTAIVAVWALMVKTKSIVYYLIS
jgi:hypothetical protein